jgi:molecular chaperone GrpE
VTDEPRITEETFASGHVPGSDPGTEAEETRLEETAPEEAVDPEAVNPQAVDPLAEALRERDEYLDALQRLKAEFDNFRRRTARDQEQLTARAHERLVKELLPVLDDLERALAAAEDHEEAQLEEGVRLVHRSLVDALRREGVSEIETDGRFDPHVHEALLSQPDDEKESGDILDVMQKGYRIGDRVVRPARVIVVA